MYERWGKRALDLAGAALGLVLLAPLIAAVALAVLAALGRPVLFRQARAGLGGAGFALLKFRSLRDGPGDDAARLTRFGRALRASGLDELPQLVNVLRGEMSLVGPRPLPIEYLPLFSARQRLRHAVRPGLAGPAQAAGRNALAWERRLELDVAYATGRLTAGNDLRVALATLLALASGRGATAPGHATAPRFRGPG